MDLDEHVHAERRRRPPRWPRASSSVTPAMMIRMQSAPRPAPRRPDRARTGNPCAAPAGPSPPARRQDIPARPGSRARRSAPTGRPRRRPHRRGKGRGIEVRADQALRRARLLDLGDQRRPPGGDGRGRAPCESRAAAPRPRAARLELGERHAPPSPRRSRRAWSPRSSQDVGHRRHPCETATRLFEPVARVALVDRAPRRARTPSPRSFALPATMSAAPAFRSTMSR